MDQNSLEGLDRDDQSELNQLREALATRTTQCNQLSEVNQAWSQFQQAQLEQMRNKLEEKLPIDPSLSLDQVAQRIVDHLTEQQDRIDRLRSGNFSFFLSFFLFILLSRINDEYNP